MAVPHPRSLGMTSRFAGCEHREVQGCPVLFLRDGRFKTFRVAFLAQRPLDDTLAARALVPALLLHGTRAHADRPALARARERLYGAAAGPAVVRHAETVLLRLQADAVAGAFLPGRPDQFGGALRLLADLALHPNAASPDFPRELFERERAQAVAAERAVYDDKGAFARQRALALACRGEPYAIPDLGGAPALEALLPGAPAAMLPDFLARGRRFCIAMGALPEDVPAALASLLGELPAAAPGPLAPTVVPAPRAAARARERAPMLQAKAVLVLRAPVPGDVAAHCALQAMLSLWGGGPHSRLFREVRERRSLCYYASAGGDVRKGVVLVQSGCEAAQVDAVVSESLLQLDELRAGRFADHELQTVVATITGALRAIDDSLQSRAQFTAEQWLLGQDQDPAARAAAYRAVSRDQVVAAARSLWLDHDYALLPEEAR
jgi:predicted Zn-dependent peptidase